MTRLIYFAWVRERIGKPSEDVELPKDVRTAAEAVERWQLGGLTAIHRHGRIRTGENIVMVAAASSHRHAAFEAAAFLMDYLKSRAPFWKKEHRVDGRDGDWVDARDEDAAAVERWRDPGVNPRRG